MTDVITGMHAIVYSPAAEKVRAFFADVLGMPSADAGGGWLIFALPPAELAVHPVDGDTSHELCLMCDDIHATLAELRDKGVEVARDVSDQRWGLLAAVRLPDGSELTVYEPRHPSPPRQTPLAGQTPATGVVRASFQAYRSQDRQAAERLLADDFTFTSPQDDHIGKSEFFQRCFPTAGRFKSQEIKELTAAGDDGVFLMYEYELTTGERYRNAEFSAVRNGQIATTEVFFGGRV
jgi:ketosteroid isomerase-like protein/catechol 2,3-dioxygenase-like lactoylglutathione lyase family enzyme